MKELSTETIEIDGQEYTLFLNRNGIVAWEKYTISLKEKANEFKKKYSSIINDTNEINDETNPFEQIEKLNDFENDKEVLNKIYKRLYWIMLYTNHKLSLTQVNDLYDKACEEYGEEQLIMLGIQMIKEVNLDPTPKKELKNLSALKPTKE